MKNIFILFAIVSSSSSLCAETVDKISFANYDWKLKSGEGVGAGHNNWANNSDAAFVDSDGQLHLRITKQKDKWWAAEASLPKSLGYGTYEFVVDSPADKLARNVVAALFFYQNDEQEYDIEISRYDGEADRPNTNFIIQPTIDFHIQRVFVDIPKNSTALYRMIFSPQGIRYEVEANDATTTWDYQRKENLIDVGQERLMMNIWLWTGGDSAPKDDKIQDFIIKSFKFTPAVKQPELKTPLTNSVLPK